MKLCTHFILVYNTIMVRLIIMNINNHFYSFLLIFIIIMLNI